MDQHFPPALEREFSDQYVATNLPMVRRNILVSAVVVTTISVLYFAYTQSLEVTSIIAFVAGIVMNLGFYVATTTRRFLAHYDMAVMVGLLCYTGFIGAAFYHLPDTWFTLAFAAMVLQTLNNYFSIGLRATTATVAASLSSAMWVVLCLSRGIYPTLLGGPLVLVFYFVVTNVLGATVSRGMERRCRSEFLLKMQLDAARQNSEALLLNILPAKIAQRLKSGETIADFHGEATVVFADLAGFTAMAARMTARELVALLNELFSAFDDATDRRGLEKIKTIGDSYLAVAGLGEANDAQAGAALDLALDMQQVVADVSRTRGISLHVRIGVHTGPLVAGVIGKRKFAFDCWGDTVNVASRLESSALTDSIQVSDETRRYAGDGFVFERREVELRGLGIMTCNVLKGRVDTRMAA